MASSESIQDFVLKGVASLNRKELGRGAYGKVYAVKYCETICAAKEIHSILIEDVGETERRQTIESFLRECGQCSMLRHPNVIQFLGVYYPTGGGGADRMQLPVMVMEMMADSLTSFVDKHEKIPVHTKYSIVHDVSLGLCYLHNHDPPIVHRDLSPNNVLLTAHHVAKISDLGVAKVIKADSRKTMTKAPGTVDFMPPEALDDTPEYGPPMDVFSFAGIILHIFNQQWPNPSKQVQFDPKTRRRVALSEVERRQQYLDKMIGEAEVLRPLVEECLDDDPAVRPTIATICEKIKLSKDVYMKESPDSLQDVITLHHEIKQLRNENEQLRNENKQKDRTEPMSSTRSIPIQQVASQLNRVTLGEESTAEISRLKIEAPPLMPALTSGRYHIKWTQLADLPAPLYDVYIAVQYHKVYVTGSATVEDARHQVFVYNVITDQWGQLPPSGHYYGIPHIIGGKLTIIGGRLSATKKRTNKLSTFDEDSQTWTSYYPDLLSVRSKPGVVSHLEHVIVAGGDKGSDDKPVTQDDIEVLNWIEDSHWRKVSIRLPVPMSVFRPTIAGDHLLIVGYTGADARYNGAYKIPFANITASIDQQSNSDTSSKWTELTAADHWGTTLVPSVCPLVIVGGEERSTEGGTTTANIKVYDDTKRSWEYIGSLSSARSYVGVAVVYNNAVIVIGGSRKGGGTNNWNSSIVTLVELGQPVLLH